MAAGAVRGHNTPVQQECTTFLWSVAYADARHSHPWGTALVAGENVDPESYKCQHQSENQSDQNSDELRRTFRGRLGGLGDPECIDKRIGKKKKWFHDVSHVKGRAEPILAGHIPASHWMQKHLILCVAPASGPRLAPGFQEAYT